MRRLLPVGSALGSLATAPGWPASDFAVEDCDLIYGNELNRVVSWRGNSNLSRFEGKMIRLKFEMKDADLFALQFAQA